MALPEVIGWAWNLAKPFDEPGWTIRCQQGHNQRTLRTLEEQGIGVCAHGDGTMFYFQSDASRNELLVIQISAAQANHIASNQLTKAQALAYLGQSWPP